VRHARRAIPGTRIGPLPLPSLLPSALPLPLPRPPPTLGRRFASHADIVQRRGVRHVTRLELSNRGDAPIARRSNAIKLQNCFVRCLLPRGGRPVVPAFLSLSLYLSLSLSLSSLSLSLSLSLAFSRPVAN